MTATFADTQDVTAAASGHGLELYLNALYGAEPAGAYVELRGRRPTGGMGQVFYPVREVGKVAAAIRRRGPATDVYVGVAPRSREQGTRAAIEHVHVLWADCDGELAVAALRAFRPLPAIVVASGSGSNVHAYWPLLSPLAASHAERANRRLAHALGADVRCADAARILRPPETFNHKGEAPAPVVLRRCKVEVFEPAEVVGHLPDPAPELAPKPHGAQRGAVRHAPGVDPLLEIAPAVYVEMLTGERPHRDGKIRCPLPDHEDRTPSCAVYDDPEQGWYCFGCGRGGSIYDLAAAVSGIGTRGEDFKRLQTWIAQRLLNTPVAA